MLSRVFYIWGGIVFREGLFPGGPSFRRVFSRGGLFAGDLVFARACFTGGVFPGRHFLQTSQLQNGGFSHEVPFDRITTIRN